MSFLQRAATGLSVVVLVLGGCGGSGGPAADSAEEQSSGVSYFLLRDDSWELVDAEESSGSLDSLGIIWGLSYERDAGAGKHVNAALALLETDKAEELASQVAFEDTDATIDGEGVSVWAEHSPQDDHLVATHLRWKATGGVAWLTVYETEPADALPLLSRVEDVPKAEWDAAAADILDEGESTS